MRSASNESGTLRTERGTFAWRQEPVPARWYTTHTLGSGGHISPANIKVCPGIVQRIPLSTANPLITADEMCSVIKSFKRRTGERAPCTCLFGCLLLVLCCEKRHPAPVRLINSGFLAYFHLAALAKKKTKLQ